MILSLRTTAWIALFKLENLPSPRLNVPRMLAENFGSHATAAECRFVPGES